MLYRIFEDLIDIFGYEKVHLGPQMFSKDSKVIPRK